MEALESLRTSAAVAAAETADLVAFQRRLRQEMTDVIQQLRKEINETAKDRIDMFSGINTALQNVAKPAASNPYRVSDLIPRNWESRNDEG